MFLLSYFILDSFVTDPVPVDSHGWWSYTCYSTPGTRSDLVMVSPSNPLMVSHRIRSSAWTTNLSRTESRNQEKRNSWNLFQIWMNRQTVSRFVFNQESPFAPLRVPLENQTFWWINRLLAFSFVYHSFERCLCLVSWTRGGGGFSKSSAEKNRCYTNICVNKVQAARAFPFSSVWSHLKSSSMVLFGGCVEW